MINQKNSQISEYLKVTVITVCYNSLGNLKKSLEALEQQDYPNIESIIVDGGSRDGCKEYAQEFLLRFVKNGRSCRVISEPDMGIFDAANKGLRLATGDIVGFYWDEYATNHALTDLVTALCEKNADVVHSDLYYVGADGEPVRKWKMGEGTIREGWMPGHPTFYAKKWVYDTYGEYDISLKNSADYDFMVRCLADKNIRVAYLPEVTIHMFYGGTSTSGLRSYMRSYKEVLLILRRHHMYPALWIAFRRVLRTMRQFQ